MGSKQKCQGAWSAFSAAVLEYDTPKIVHIQNKKVGVLYRLFQLAIMGFMIGSVCSTHLLGLARLAASLTISGSVITQVQYHIFEGLPRYADRDRSGHLEAERRPVLQRHRRRTVLAELRRGQRSASVRSG